jgi:hypothetical protein
VSPESRWSSVADGLLRGLAHALSNRVAALQAVTQLLDVSTTISGELRAALAGEAGRLNALVELLRVLPLGPASAIRLPELLPEVLALHAMHPDLPDPASSLAVDADPLPVHGDAAALTRALLLLLWVLSPTGVEAEAVSVRIDGDEEWAVVDLAGSATRETGAAVLREAEAMLERGGFEAAIVLEDDRQPGVRLRIATLARRRRLGSS